MRLPLLIIISTCSLLARGQLTESFSDSNFTANPVWAGTPGAWTVTAGRQLQSTYMVANSSCYLSSACTIGGALQWDLWLRLAFATSSANYIDVWVQSANANPEAPGNVGYFVRIGGTQDDICLYRKDLSGTVRIIDGADGVAGSSDNRLQLQVARSQTGIFYLRRSLDGSGSFSVEGSVSDNTYTGGAWFALLLRQSSAAFFGRHYFDDIHIGPFIPDSTAPVLLSVEAINDSGADLRFSEAIATADARQLSNYQCSGGMGQPIRALPDALDGSLVHLTFASHFPEGQMLLLTVLQLADDWGNRLLQDTDAFGWFPPKRHDLLITEIMADPSPTQGLPDAEYVELKNISGHAINIRGWKLSTATAQSAPFPVRRVEADSFLLLTATGNTAQFGANTLGLTSFPALDNDGSLLQLSSTDGRSIHALAYNKSWYRNVVKDDGGWSLEMVDPQNPCGGAGNWVASTGIRGGTPGRPNSVNGPNPDHVLPHLLRTWTIDSLRIVAVFSEPLDSLSAASAQYIIDGGLTIQFANPVPPLFESVELRLSSPLAQRKVYQLRVTGVTDCAGSPIGSGNEVKAGLPEEAAALSLVWNELLYQPGAGGSEYVELFASSNSVIDLSRVFVATRNMSGQINTPKRLCPSPRLIFSGEYHVFSSDTTAVLRNYFVQQPGWLIACAGLPSLSDEGASLVLLNDQGTIIDEVHYDPDWQFGLIADAHGVALERLNPAQASQLRSNWHSAAESAGYGTPTARNSQWLGGDGDGELTITPAVFSPDNDGFDDVTAIDYRIEESGYMANLSLFDALGRPVRSLVRSAILGRSGRWTWDGLDAKGQRLPAGTYMLLAELFNLQGQKKIYKRTVTIARRF